MAWFLKYRLVGVKILIHCLALSPVIYVYYFAIIDQLGSDPVKAVIHFTGISALNLLLVTLSVSPLVKTIKQPWLLKVRRLLGLYAFFYACLHLLNFIFFELQFDFSLLLAEIIKRPYITVGMLAFIIITALAVTSINSVKRRMGKRWQRLHNFNYLLASLVCVHFFWSVKSEILAPSFYFLLLFILLYLRKDKFKRWLTK